MSVDVPAEVDHVLGPYRLGVATAYGPRLTSFSLDGSGDLFARLPDSATLSGPHGDFHLRGGHRLWVAPETPEVTYAPDDHRCEVSFSPEGVTVIGPPDIAGIGKRISVAVRGEELVVDHRVTNAGGAPLAVACWAITQLGLGGTALLPFGGGPTDGTQPDRSLVMWPYTRLSDRRLTWLDNGVAISARQGPRLKLGAGPDPGRLAYFREGFLFMKEVDEIDGPLPDRGAVGQVFVDENFSELETVGRLVTLEPGESTSHRERWRLVPCPDLPAAISEIEA